MSQERTLLTRVQQRIQRDVRNWTVRGQHLLQPDRAHKYFYVSHHKCATQYVQAILRAACDYGRIPHDKFDWREPISDWDLRLNKFLMIQDYSSDMLDWHSVQGRGFHVIRDPRDILVSLYFSHKKSHIVRDPRAQEILDNREVLNQVSEEEGLAHIMAQSQYWQRVMREIAGWDYERDDFYETRFEHITTAPFEEFKRIFAFIGLDIPDDVLHEIIDANSFNQMKKRFKGEQSQPEANHYRKGKVGDWQNHFTAAIKTRFKTQYADLLIRLGYAEDDTW